MVWWFSGESLDLGLGLDNMVLVLKKGLVDSTEYCGVPIGQLVVHRST